MCKISGYFVPDNLASNELKFAMSVPVWLLGNTASFLPQILAGKVLLKKLYHHDSLKCVLIFITISFLRQNVCLPVHFCH